MWRHKSDVGPWSERGGEAWEARHAGPLDGSRQGEGERVIAWGALPAFKRIPLSVIIAACSTSSLFCVGYWFVRSVEAACGDSSRCNHQL